MMHHTYPDRASWLASRREPGTYRIGASEVADALGFGRFGDPWDVWAKWHLPAVEVEQTSAMARGNFFEPMIIAGLRDELASVCEVRAPQFMVCWQPERDWLRATPDAVYVVSGEIVGGAEIKTDGEPGCLEAWPESGEIRDWLDNETPPIPVWYWIQVQATMECVGVNRWDLRALLMPPYKEPDLRTYKVHRSARWPAILDALTAWRERHLVGGEWPPARTREQAEAVARWRYPAPDVERSATEEEAALIEMCITQQARAKAAAATADECKRLLAESRGDAKTIYAPGVGRYTVTKAGVRVTPWSKS